MQLTFYKRSVTGYLLKAIEITLICFLLFLAFRHYQYRELTMVKVGMSHLFSPDFVGVFPYLLAAINIGGALCLIFWESKAAVLPALIIFCTYTGYSAWLYIKTGSSCGCANMFFETDLKLQMIIGAGLFLLSLMLLFKRNNA